jgi:lipopolysaccharide/colanic/teichoic acid biosynthesis glycosyltransferase
MAMSFRNEARLLFAGDIFFLIFALWTTLLVRYAAVPSWALWYTHLVPFSFLFFLSVLVFLITGLYEKHTLVVKSRVPEMVFYAQLANIALGALLFFLVPYFGITPKTNLFLYLLFSTAFVSAWRVYFFPFIFRAAPVPALLVGSGIEVAELSSEINGNTRYELRFVETLDTAGLAPVEMQQKVTEALTRTGAAIVVVPFALLRERTQSREWDTLVFSGVNLIDLETLYEEIFDRVALPQISQSWFYETRVYAPTYFYDPVKRVTDILLSLFALVLLSPLILLVAFILIMQGGSAFIFQTRVGKDNREIAIVKFRTMLFDDGEDPEKKKLNRITGFGAFLRKTQFDEVTQFWNILKGDISLIGPRPEIPRFVEAYRKDIPFYEMRHLIQPGLSGWAQIKHASPPKFKLDVEATRNKLSYDLYYLKYRSFFLDFEIILRTIKILLARASQ